MINTYQTLAFEKSGAHVSFEPRVWRLGHTVSALDAAHAFAGRGLLPIWDSVLVVGQSCGRGQLRRHWVSPPGNIYAALRLPHTAPFDGTAAAPAAGLLLVEALRSLGFAAHLKWPNDLVLMGRDGMACKVGGILLEERGNVLVAGIGINVCSAPPQADLREDAALAATCLHILGAGQPHCAGQAGFAFTAEVLWYRLVKHIYSSYNSDRPFSCAWKERVEAVLLWRGRQVLVHDEGSACARGRLLGLTDAGGLQLAMDGEYQELVSGSLRLLVP